MFSFKLDSLHLISWPRRGLRLHVVGLCAALCISIVSIGMGCQGGIEVRLAEIQALQDAGEFSSSIEPLRDVLAIDPNHAQANYLLGIALVETRQPSLAVWPLRKASESDEFAVFAGLLLASTLSQMSSFEEAVRASDLVLALEPDSAIALQMRSNANVLAGKFEDALVDADRILELQPESASGYALRALALTKLGREEEAEATILNLIEMAESSGDENAKVRGCLALVTLREDPEEAEPLLKKCVAKHPNHPLVLAEVSNLYDKLKRPEEATRIWRSAVEQVPDNFGFRQGLAQRLIKEKKFDQAETLLVETAELFGDVRGWERLASYQQRRGDFEKAKKAIGRAMEAAGGRSDELRFRQADLLIDLGELDQAEQVMAELKSEVYRELVRGRVLIHREQYREALEALESGLRRWPNNSGARYLAGQAAQRLGDFAKAISHYREAFRSDEKANDAALALSEIFLATGNYADAGAFARKHIQNRRVNISQALIVLARASAAQGGEEGFERARKALAELAGREGQGLRAAVELAAVELRADAPEAALAAIEQSGIDLSAPENALALRSAIDVLLALDRSDAAAQKISAALRKQPDSALLHDIHGRFLFVNGKKAEAKQAFEKALAVEDEFAPALAALGLVAVDAGSLEEALSYFDRAVASDPADSDSSYSGAQIEARLGRPQKSESRLRKLLARDPGHAAACNDLAWMLADQGRELAFALDLAERAVRLDPRAEILDTLGWVQLKRGEGGAALASFEQALELKPELGSLRYRLGLAQQSLGRSDAALESFRAAISSGPFPEQDAAREEISRLEAIQQAAR